MSQEHLTPGKAMWRGFISRCPRCGQGALFQGFLTPAARCSHCKLDYSFVDSGDGPAIFIMLFGGFIVLGISLWLEMAYEPPVWVHLLVFTFLTCVICMGSLRPLKGMLIALQYRNQAEEGRLEG